MNRLVLLVVVLLLILGASAAQAATASLSWGPTCWSDPGHTNLAAFACNTNTGEVIMTVSFTPDQDIAHFCRLGLTLYATAWGQLDIPDWWKLGTGQCRSGTMSVSVDFSAAPQVGCTDAWAGRNAFPIVDSYVTTPTPDDPNHYYPPVARLEAEAVIDPVDAPHLTAGTEYYGMQVRVSYLRTVGAGACAGCSHPLNWDLVSVALYDCDGSSQVAGPDYQANGSLTWDPGMATPARNPTWGAIKSLYR